MAYPSNGGESTAHTQIRALVERVERLDEELKAINEDKKEIFSEARGNGFDVAALKQVIKIRRQDANERLEREAIIELYMSALGMVPAPENDAAPVHVHMRVENIEQFGSDEAEKSNLQKVQTAPTEPQEPDADPSPAQMPSVDAADLPADDGIATSLAGAEGIADQQLLTEPQPAPQAGSDLTASPANDDGQVADNPVAKAADDANSGDAMSEVSAVADAPEQADVASRVAGDRAPAATSEDMDATGGESAATKSLYAPKGETVWELTPPEGVIRHEYSQAFGEAGQDIAVIEDDMAKAASAPIVKIGNVILDGWARYLKARELGIEYPVEQYSGTDSLMDCIKWNTGGRMMTSEQSFRIAQRLAKAEPKRKADIYAAFELGMALA